MRIISRSTTLIRPASSRPARADSSRQNGTRYELNTSYEFWEKKEKINLKTMLIFFSKEAV